MSNLDDKCIELMRLHNALKCSRIVLPGVSMPLCVNEARECRLRSRHGLSFGRHRPVLPTQRYTHIHVSIDVFVAIHIYVPDVHTHRSMQTCCHSFYMVHPPWRCRGVGRHATPKSRGRLQHGPQICSRRQEPSTNEVAACIATVFLSVVSQLSRLFARIRP
jgi:hypothetical protein